MPLAPKSLKILIKTPKNNIALIVGLANPGSEYANTRHNVGAWFVNALLALENLQLKLNTRLHANIASSSAIKYLIATTYMNESGLAVQAVAQYYKISPEAILVAHDDLDLDPGVVRHKASGGHGGHNGIRDIIKCLGSNNFQRLKFGIGHPNDKNRVADYVLSKPNNADKISINNAIDLAITNRSDYGF